MGKVSETSEPGDEAAEQLAVSSPSLTSWTAPAGTSLALEENEGAAANEASELDVARALLTGGEEGIRVWNGRRQEPRRRVDLSRIDLKGANLSSADLSDCVLRNANLSSAVLFGARLDRSDVAGADLTNARLDAASLRKARLLNVRASGASFRFCDLAGADLRNANFQGASLSPVHLAEADLTGAQFSADALDDLKASVSSLESAGDHPRRIYFALLGLCVFSALTAVGASDVSLIAGLGAINVPLLDTSVSPRGFFFVAPVACLIMMLYMAAHVRQLERAARELPARFPEGATLAEKLTPWMQNIAPVSVKRRAVLEDGSDAAWSVPTLSRRLLVASTRWAVPVTTTLMLIAYFRSRRASELWMMAALVLSAWLTSYLTWRPVGRGAVRTHALFGLTLCGVGLLVWGLGSASSRRFQARGFDLKNLELSNVGLRAADLSYANLSRGTLERVDLTGAIMIGTDLSSGGGRFVTLQRSRLNKAILHDAYFTHTTFAEAQMVGANLEGVELRDVSLRGADLTRANLTNAELHCVDLRGAQLPLAKLDQARADALWCDDPNALPSPLADACTRLDDGCRARLKALQGRP
jgi:uncharacterized protein YjbI with pentapeptide repeats